MSKESSHVFVSVSSDTVLLWLFFSTESIGDSIGEDIGVSIRDVVEVSIGDDVGVKVGVKVENSAGDSARVSGEMLLITAEECV